MQKICIVRIVHGIHVNNFDFEKTINGKLCSIVFIDIIILGEGEKNV
jgi:hypothetical protein